MGLDSKLRLSMPTARNDEIKLRKVLCVDSANGQRVDGIPQRHKPLTQSVQFLLERSYA